MIKLFDQVSFQSGKLVTNLYSTSFSLGCMLLHKRIRVFIYAIYGFVRFADEIVDTFHDYDKPLLLSRFREDTYRAIDERISLNPILHGFQIAVNRYNIDRSSIDSFLESMESDLYESNHDLESYKKYIYGSAEVVGLMCLRVFVEGDEKKYESLKEHALALGSAFQKVNFLRDMNFDTLSLGRAYFPEIQFRQFDHSVKKQIEDDIHTDFAKAYQGILKLPKTAQLGVYVAYVYYYKLFLKIKRTAPSIILSTRTRIPNAQKIFLLTESYFKHSLSLVK